MRVLPTSRRPFPHRSAPGHGGHRSSPARRRLHRPGTSRAVRVRSRNGSAPPSKRQAGPQRLRRPRRRNRAPPARLAGEENGEGSPHVAPIFASARDRSPDRRHPQRAALAHGEDRESESGGSDADQVQGPDACRPRDRRPCDQERVQGPMNRIAARKKDVGRLRVDRDVGTDEGREAQVPWRGRLQQKPGPDVERGNRHLTPWRRRSGAQARLLAQVTGDFRPASRETMQERSTT